MAASATGSIKVTLTGDLKNALTDGQSVSTQIGTSPSLSLTSGTGLNQFNRGWQSKNRALLAAASENIDLYDLGSLDLGAGAGEDSLGLTIAATGLVALCVENLSTSAGNLIVGGLGATTAWNDAFNADDDAAIKLPPNSGVLLWAVGATAWAIADVSNHLLKIAASGGNCSYNICVFLRG